MRRIALLGLLLAGPVAAQEFRALLEGTVTDPTGAVIPFAKVTLTSATTSVKRFSNADAAGHFVFQFLPPGNYALSAGAAGFRTVLREGVTLETNQRAHMNVELPVGGIADTVLITGDVSLVQHDSSAL